MRKINRYVGQGTHGVAYMKRCCRRQEHFGFCHLCRAAPDHGNVDEVLQLGVGVRAACAGLREGIRPRFHELCWDVTCSGEERGRARSGRRRRQVDLVGCGRLVGVKA